MFDLNRVWGKNSHWFVLLGILLATYWGVLDVRLAQASQRTMARALYQASPLATPAQQVASPLATPAPALTPASAVASSGNQTSLILVGIVLIGVLFIIALVMWRQKQK
jgi:predicted MFS family arabinose efflux permease